MLSPISFTGVLALALIAVEVRALPRKPFEPASQPTISDKRASTKDTATGATGGAAAAAPSTAPKVTKATDGSTILAKTAVIK